MLFRLFCKPEIPLVAPRTLCAITHARCEWSDDFVRKTHMDTKRRVRATYAKGWNMVTFSLLKSANVPRKRMIVLAYASVIRHSPLSLWESF